MNQVITNALTKLNQEKVDKAVDQIKANIAYITQEQEKIEGFNDSIKVHQEELAKLISNVLTADRVLGRPASALPNANEVAVLKAIKDRNDGIAWDMESKSKAHLSEIDGYNSAIKGCEDRIAGLRKGISDLVVEGLTIEQVLG